MTRLRNISTFFGLQFGIWCLFNDFYLILDVVVPAAGLSFWAWSDWFGLFKHFLVVVETIHICYVRYILVVPFSRELRKLAYRPQKQTNVWPWVAYVWWTSGTRGLTLSSSSSSSSWSSSSFRSLRVVVYFFSGHVLTAQEQPDQLNLTELGLFVKHCY